MQTSIIAPSCHRRHPSKSSTSGWPPPTDDHVWEIVARWQGIKPLYDLYSLPSIQKRFREADYEVFEPYDLMYHTEVLPRPYEEMVLEKAADMSAELREHCQPGGQIDREEGVGSYEHFYVALVAGWLNIEVRRVGLICYCKFQSEQNELWDVIKALWTGKTFVLLFHMIEVQDFVYGFLMRELHCTRVDTIDDWYAFEMPRLPWEEEEPEGARDIGVWWKHWVDEIQLTLSPPDIIQLLILTSFWRTAAGKPHEWSRERKTQYLRIRYTHRAYSSPVPAVDDGKYTSTHYSVNTLQHAIASTIAKNTDIPYCDVERIWIEYRYSVWDEELRGRALTWATSDTQIVRDLFDEIGEELGQAVLKHAKDQMETDTSDAGASDSGLSDLEASS